MGHGSRNYVPHKKPRHCPAGHWRCSMCNVLMRFDDSLAGPPICDRCAEEIRPDDRVIGIIEVPPVHEFRRRSTGDEEPSPKPKRKRVRTTAKRNRKSRPVIRIEDGMRFESAMEAARVTSRGTKTAKSLYAHLNGHNKTFCGCTFRYADKEDVK